MKALCLLLVLALQAFCGDSPLRIIGTNIVDLSLVYQELRHPTDSGGWCNKYVASGTVEKFGPNDVTLYRSQTLYEYRGNGAVLQYGNTSDLLGMLAALLLGLLWLRHWRDVVFVVLAFGGAEITNVLLKALFARARPHLWPALSVETSFGFPSGHAAGSVALAAIVAILLWNTHWRVPGLLIGVLFVCLVSLSRLYLGVHYPSDVLAGAAASLTWVTLLTLTLRRELFPVRA